MRQAFSAYSWIRSKALPEFAKAIMDNGNIVTYKRNEVITKPGKIYDSISILCRGLISKAILNNTVNKYKANSLLIPGRVLGTSFFMSREPSNLMVKAIRDSVLVSVSFKFIEDKIANDKNFMAVALKQFSMDWESDLEGLAALSFYTPEQKLKILFKGLILSYEINMNTEWLKLPVKLSYSEMATVIYTTKCTIIRIINHWKKLEVVRAAKNELLLHCSLLDDVYDWKVTASSY